MTVVFAQVKQATSSMTGNSSRDAEGMAQQHKGDVSPCYFALKGDSLISR